VTLMESFVVQLIGTESSQPFKYFGSRATAQDFAASRVQSKEAKSANIYRVTGAANPYEAVGMVKAGKATLIHARSRHATDAEALAANERRQKAREAGPEALLQYLGYKLPPAPPSPPIKGRF
jgi:hypothetical protein